MRSAFSRMGNFLLSSGRAMATGIGQMAANAWARLGTFATQAGSFVANGLSAVGRAVAQTAESLWSRVTSWFGRASASLGELSGQAARVGARVGGGAALMLMPSELGRRSAGAEEAPVPARQRPAPGRFGRSRSGRS